MSLIPSLHPEDILMQCPVARGMPLSHFYRPLQTLARAASHLDAASKVTVDKNKYQMSVDVHQFAPEEITVKTIGDQVVVEGKHEEKEDHHGYVSRHFVRKYHLPKDHAAEDVVSSLSSDGVLTIVAPRKKEIAEGERIVPIQATGPAHKAVKHHPHHNGHH